MPTKTLSWVAIAFCMQYDAVCMKPSTKRKIGDRLVGRQRPSWKIPSRDDDSSARRIIHPSPVYLSTEIARKDPHVGLTV